MKTVLILDGESPSFLKNLQELAYFLAQSGAACASVELWLFGALPTDFGLPPLPLLPSRIQRILCLPALKSGLVDFCLPLLEQCYEQAPCQLLLFYGDHAGAELATRLAYRIGGASCTNVDSAAIDADACHVKKQVYGNHMQATLALRQPPYCLSITRQSVDARQLFACETPEVLQHSLRPKNSATAVALSNWLISAQTQPLSVELLNPLHHAKFVLAVGQGVGSAENTARCRQLAKALGAEFGVSRPVAMNGWCEMSRLLGMSGVQVVADICIVAGASGSAAFSTGIARSRFIVAINTNPDAPISQQADVLIVDDLNEFLPALLAIMAP